MRGADFCAVLKKVNAKKGRTPMLRAIVAVFLILWLLGAVLHIGGAAIHVLVVAAVVILLYDLVTRRGAKKE